MRKFLLFLTLFSTTVLGVMAQTPPCNPITVTDTSAWLNDFSTAPNCWTFPTGDDSTSWHWDDVTNDIYHDYGIYESDVISPILDISGVTRPYLKFSQKRTDYSFSTVSDELYVYFRSTATGGDSTWYMLSAYTAVCNDWYTDSIPLPSNQTTIQFKFHAVGNGDLANGVNINFVSVYNEENAPSCIAPTALNAFNIGNYSVELSWAFVSSGNVNLYYKVISDTVFNLVETPMLTDGVFLLDNLETAKQYVWYLDMDCGGENAQTPLHYFTTACGLLSAPHFEDFEYVNTGKSPACWDILNSVVEGAYTFPGVNNINNEQYTHSGNHSYKFRNNSVAQYAIMPEFDNVFSTLQVNFWTRREGSGSGSFSVGYVTDSLTAGNFVALLTLNGSEIGDNSFHNYTVRYDSVTTAEDSHYYIAFKYECAENWNWFMDDIRVTEITPCTTPDSLSASNATGTSIDLHWTGNADEYTVYYRVSGEISYDHVDNVILNTNGVYTLEGLTPSSNYEWYVEAYCSDGTVTSSFVTAHFTTACGAISSVPTTWNLEDNLAGGTSDYPMPTCWDRISANSTTPNPYIYHQSSNAHSGNKSLRFYNRYANSYAVMPAVDNAVLSFSNLQLTFHAKASMENAATSLEVGVMSDPNDASTFTTISTIHPTSSYLLYEIPFNGYTGSGNHIAIRNVSTTTSVYTYYYVDDITLSSVSTCTTPLNLTATSSTHSATLSWVSSGTTFTIYYKEANDDSWQTESNVSLNSNNEYVLTGLLDGTAYDWYVETACGMTPELASAHAYFSTIMEPIDLPYQTDFSDNQEWLMNNGHASNYWMMGTPIGATQTALFITNDGYTAGYNTSVNAVVTAEKAFNMPEGGSVHVEFDVQVGGEGGYNPADYLKVFLAPNTMEFTVGASSSNAQSAAGYETHAFNFSDYIWLTLEHNYPYKLNLTQDSTLHISMNVANPTVNGEAKIVFLWRNDDYLGTQPSAIIRNLFITSDTTYTPPIPPTPVSCTSPTNVSVTNVGYNSADISWIAGDNETAWNLQYKESLASGWSNSIPVTSPTYHLADLESETSYQVRIQANCIDTLSDWTSPVNFTTQGVGIDNISLANSISLMPNPADNYIELNINSNVEVKEAVVFNAFGQMIQTVELNDNHARIDLSNMASGMYFVRVNGEDGNTATKKFIKK